jgi:hypothetical protein
MILIEHTDVYESSLAAAIRGMRNPKNSWILSDSDWTDPLTYKIGKKDLTLAEALATAGTDHGKFLRQIILSADITAPLYWWKEYDTYKVGTVTNSCSTMHKIHDKIITRSDFSHEYLYEDNGRNKNPIEVLDYVISELNYWRNKYIKTRDKNAWWKLIQLLPSSYNQKRTVTLNYAVLRNIYHSRSNHKLDEWRDFCKWIKDLPYAEELIISKRADET